MVTALRTKPAAKTQTGTLSCHNLKVVEGDSAALLDMATPAELCNYIEEMTQQLRGLAIHANQKFIAYLLGMAAQEAGAEYYRLSRNGARL